ncbi:MAG: hypothetical protein HN704_10945 [Bacteroidetes bacterium]|jgi:hypothetical protein|nr:hypothetical protein [Bacteroidota bacterium]MBT6687997.1 hypothetical protein [Bacteroidota bacterium]MBT7144938.1 hypothetical protein [Bacteroidota bacterium]MBT7492108.1 hypothetical protein [Bacteroidota bacterium]
MIEFINKWPFPLLVLCSLFVCKISESQEIENRYFAYEEDSLQVLFENIYVSKNDSDKIKYNEQVLEIFEEILYDEQSFTEKFDSLKWMGKLRSPDGVFRIYNWNLVFTDGTHKYFGFLQYYHKKKKIYLIYPLFDKSDEILDPEKKYLKNTNWYGALYYEIIANKHKRNKYYTLLAWDGNNNFTNKKIIETLRFSPSGKPHFGISMFKINKKRKKRLFFEYSDKVYMQLNYDKSKEMIVFDHLSPSQEKFKGNYQYYGPDFSIDGLFFKKGKWILKEDLDIRRKKNNKPKWKYDPSENFY